MGRSFASQTVVWSSLGSKLGLDIMEESLFIKTLNKYCYYNDLCAFLYWMSVQLPWPRKAKTSPHSCETYYVLDLATTRLPIVYFTLFVLSGQHLTGCRIYLRRVCSWLVFQSDVPGTPQHTSTSSGYFQCGGTGIWTCELKLLLTPSSGNLHLTVASRFS